jgi:hypothetical protein
MEPPILVPMLKKHAIKDYFSPYAPPHDLPFPRHANLTAYELLAFLPNSIQSVDVLYRFASNGATRRAIWSIVNSARDLPKEWHKNSCGSVITKSMNDAGFLGWTMTIHDLWHTKMTNWNEARMDVFGFRTPEDFQGKPNGTDNIPFKDLAISVRRFPHGDDALDLTRMVLYCQQNPENNWLYPRDYDELLNMLGGPSLIRRGHFDREVFKRWDSVEPLPARIWSAEELEKAKNVLESKREKKKKEANDKEKEEKAKSKEKEKAEKARSRTPAAKRQSRNSTPNVAGPSKPRGRPPKRTKLEVIDLEAEKIDVEDKAEAPYEPYVRRPAEYVAAPDKVKTPSVIALKMAFAAEAEVGETDVFSAYAFGGPRHSIPFRMLHDIQQPDKSDVSGWAENLRWAYAQRACFWHAVETEGWNESPAHMELIAETRKNQVWASDELLEQLADD